ncbi:DEAD/DEAH box helicase [Actinophytocola gossypii]|uniref:AAA family ATPase n=1 Tax=Actinophytocola gossypii TaxID=2812003 RepID=A0ABT2JI36_9PSEU|nr:AAA domain-containing protein [Actinophytocola gossypii]MCT2587550.1 AAA family ATPase [Actinophytocola gossypii]
MFANQLQVGEVDMVEFIVPSAQVPSWLTTLIRKPKLAQPNEVSVTQAGPGAGYDAVLRHSDGSRLRARAVDRARLNLFATQGRAVASWIAQARQSGHDDIRVMVQCHGFASMPLLEPLSVSVDDEVARLVRTELRSDGAPFEDVARWLREQFALPAAPGRGRQRLVHSGGPSVDPWGGLGAFTMHGVRWVADVVITEDRLCIVRMTDNRPLPKFVRLSEVELTFTDRTSAALAGEKVRAALAGLADGARPYMEMWSEYNNIERDAIIEEALRLKWGQYRGWQVQADGVIEFQLHPGDRAAEFLRAAASYDGKLELEAAADPPPEIAGPGGNRSSGTRGVVESVSRLNWTVNLTLPQDGDRPDPPPFGYLFRSLSGDRTRLRRRDEARDRIWSGQAEMRGLALLFEGQPDPNARQRVDRNYDRVLTAAVREAFGGKDPTSSQLEALKLALRTPDIVLVQGPPGTGKTQFITALLRALDLLGDNALALNRTLITSFQHDAVDNVAGRARHRGLPPTRVDSQLARRRQHAREWRTETLAVVNGYLAEHRRSALRREEVNQLRQLAASIGDRPVGDADLVGILDTAKRLAGDDLPARLRGRIERARSAITGRIRGRHSLTTKELAAASATIRSIRAIDVAFADDGPARAAFALSRLTELGLLDENDKALLELAGDSEPDGGMPLVADLAKLRLSLLDGLRSGGLNLTGPTRDPEVETLLDQLAEAVAEATTEHVDSADDVLLAYRADLAEDLAEVESTLGAYNSVLASTVQQAQSMEMNRVLDAPLPVFETVIVDEAARANPLDLMIPLSCARTRIVLVGDHKQLPHVLEQKVERELLRNRKADTADLSTSLFERWFTMFGEQDAKIRTIRLDTQFRMHPDLGRFVSEVFYGGPEAIRSHPSTESLTHDLSPYRGKVAGWIDVPLASGGEQRSGTSRVRLVEAERLVRELARLVELDTEETLTFGLITFYKAQKEAIEAELVSAELGVMNDDDEFEPARKLQWTREEKPRPRLRVGTVDAFQGMEFDVVLLSVTRSSEPPEGPVRVDEAIRRYGHLLRDSRMCVAMSRQRRLLIAVGDAAMADRSALPVQENERGETRSMGEGLVAFLELCEGESGAGIRT